MKEGNCVADGTMNDTLCSTVSTWQVVVVCGSKAPVGHFRVSLSLKNRTYATPPISAQAVASVR